jgi:uncharacterized phage-associated protein
MLNPVLVANYFVYKTIQEGGVITPMKAVKLTYIAHGWWLAIKEGSLLDENPEAWEYGPVVPRVYFTFKKYGSHHIHCLEKEPIVYGEDASDLSKIPEDIKSFLDLIWNGYKKYDGIELSALTHRPNTPWDIVWNQMGGKSRKHSQIPDTLIRNHYIDLLKTRQNMHTNE